MGKSLRPKRIKYKELYLKEKERANVATYRAHRLDAVAETYFNALCEYGNLLLDALTKQRRIPPQEYKVLRHEWISLSCKLGTMSRFEHGQDKHDLPNSINIHGRPVVMR